MYVLKRVVFFLAQRKTVPRNLAVKGFLVKGFTFGATSKTDEVVGRGYVQFLAARTEWPPPESWGWGDACLPAVHGTLYRCGTRRHILLL